MCIVCDTATPSHQAIQRRNRTDRSHVYIWVRRLPHIKPSRSRLIVAAQTFTFFVYRLRKMCDPVGPWHCALLGAIAYAFLYKLRIQNSTSPSSERTNHENHMDIVCNSRNHSGPHECVSRARASHGMNYVLASIPRRAFTKLSRILFCFVEWVASING